MAPSEPITLYLYAFSPYGRKVTQYLTLRNISYSVVEQPPMLPRPDVDALGVAYRRIPLMALGRDIYCDTKCILDKLEALYPPSNEHPALGAGGRKAKALEILLDKWSTAIVFQSACTTIPADLAPMQNEAFTKDRSDLWGGTWGPERQREMRPVGLQNMREDFAFLDTLAKDGDKFATGDQVGLADIHALFTFDWLDELVPGALPDNYRQQFPDVFAWLDRYRAAVKAAAGKAATPGTLQGDAAADKVLSAGFAEAEGDVDAADPIAQGLGLKKGDRVDVWATDIVSGHKHRETGSLVALSPVEVVVERKAQAKDVSVRVHFPRWNYKVQKV